jgi:hypothetical protein
MYIHSYIHAHTHTHKQSFNRHMTTHTHICVYSYLTAYYFLQCASTRFTSVAYRGRQHLAFQPTSSRPGHNVIKLFAAVSYDFHIKLERLTLASLSSLV